MKQKKELESYLNSEVSFNDLIKASVSGNPTPKKIHGMYPHKRK